MELSRKEDVGVSLSASYPILPIAAATLLLYLVQIITLYISGRQKKLPKSSEFFETNVHGRISSGQPADQYSFAHLYIGVASYYAIAYLLGKKATIEEKYLLALTSHVAFETLENNPIFLKAFGQVFDPKYDGDSVVNSLTDTVWFSYGFWLASKIQWKVLLALIGVEEMVKGLWLKENAFSILWKMKMNKMNGVELEELVKAHDKTFGRRRR